jgi:ABC-type transport system involved in multi-copper enzyme maturation permease subunit
MSAPTVEAAPPVEPARAGTTEAARRKLPDWSTSLRLRANPVLRRELRVRMRGRRAFVVLGAYLLLVGAIVFGIHRILVSDESGGRLQSFQVGQLLFAAFTLVEMSLLALIAPALTATAISGEREGGTFDLLRATPVRAHTIVWGKLLAALGYAALLIVASIPIASAVFLFGGVSPEDVWTAFLLLVVTTVTFGLLGLFCSALVRTSGFASVLSYVLTVAVVVGSIGTYVFLDAIDGGLVDNQVFQQQAVVVNGGAQVVAANGGGSIDASQESDQEIRLLLSVNPMMAMASLLADSIDQSPADPFSGPSRSMTVLDDWLEFVRVGDNAFQDFAFDMQGRPLPVERADADPLWHDTLWIYGAASLVLFVTTTFLVARSGGATRRSWGPRFPKQRARPSPAASGD